MTYITADELIPVAHEYGHKHVVSVGLLSGILARAKIQILRVTSRSKFLITFKLLFLYDSKA